MATVMQAVQGFQERTFSSLRIRNYRLYVLGQGVSLSGTWMQTIAQGLLVLRLTGSGKVMRYATLPLALLLLALAAPAHAQIHLQGTVREEEAAAPIEGVTVTGDHPR